MLRERMAGVGKADQFGRGMARQYVGDQDRLVLDREPVERHVGQRIGDRPAPLVLSDGTRVTGQTQDAPAVVLAVVLVVSAMLSVTLVVLRR
jgi:hypothetical protein